MRMRIELTMIRRSDNNNNINEFICVFGFLFLSIPVIIIIIKRLFTIISLTESSLQ
jgi:hypothetical protein